MLSNILSIVVILLIPLYCTMSKYNKKAYKLTDAHLFHIFTTILVLIPLSQIDCLYLILLLNNQKIKNTTLLIIRFSYFLSIILLGLLILYLIELKCFVKKEDKSIRDYFKKFLSL